MKPISLTKKIHTDSNQKYEYESQKKEKKRLYELWIFWSGALLTSKPISSSLEDGDTLYDEPTITPSAKIII